MASRNGKSPELNTDFDNIEFNEPIRQQKLEDFYEAYLPQQRRDKPGDNGAVVRSAIEAGWLAKGQYIEGEPDVFTFDGVPVGELEGWQTGRIADQVNARYVEAMTIPLASSSPPQPTRKAKGQPQAS
jgi:hypothetical protein